MATTRVMNMIVHCVLSNDQGEKKYQVIIDVSPT